MRHWHSLLWGYSRKRELRWFRIPTRKKRPQNGYAPHRVDTRKNFESTLWGAYHIAAFYAALTARGIRPKIHMSGKRIEKQLNREALGRVFGNILSNALKYSDGDLEINLSDDGEIVFANTATGLNEIQVGKLFDRFFTVEAARNSGGLGLAISRTLVEQMGGSISAKMANSVLSIQIRFP